MYVPIFRASLHSGSHFPLFPPHTSTSFTKTYRCNFNIRMLRATNSLSSRNTIHFIFGRRLNF